MERVSHSGRERGSLMIEAMVAVTLILVGLLGIFGLIGRSLSMNKDVHDRFVATYLAAEGIEVVKNIIDTDVAAAEEGASNKFWNSTIRSGNTYAVQYDTTASGVNGLKGYAAVALNFDPSTGLYSYTHASQPSIFYRAITVKQPASGTGVEVVSAVTWTADGTKNTVTLSDTFTGWRQ